jgi:NitT/TauT family transport system ATP-binding protein
MPTNDHILELKNISQAYGSVNQRFVAIEDLNLIIDEGEFVTLLGPSGCDKSTLLRIIAGLQQPSEGMVLYREKPLLGINPHNAIVFQKFALFPWLTAQQNIEVVLKTRGIPLKPRIARAIELLGLVGLGGFENAYPRELSGGMRQKVGFARVMAT